MEDNVALDSGKQKQFLKSIKGINKLVKKGKIKQPLEIKEKATTDTKKKPKQRKERGLVYLGHIPHGFYENQMTDYFKQFGKVTNCRVIRSKKTGNSKGYAFVEFGDTTVAQIVAETMNNYLMGKRLLKAEYIPPEKQKRLALRKHWNNFNNPGNIARMKAKKEVNRSKTEKEELVMAKKFLKTFTKVKENLSKLGIEYDFVQPVDVPEELVEKIDIKKEEDNSVSKKNKSKDHIETSKTDTKSKKEEKKADKKSQNNNEVKNKKQDLKANKAGNQPAKTESKKQVKSESKNQVKPLEDFLSIDQSDTDDSDGSDDFDSDSFKQLNSDVDEFDSEDVSDSQSDGDEDSDNNDVDDSENDDSEEEPLPAKKVPLPAKKVPLPAKKVPIPAKKVPLPAKKVPLPAKKVPLPAKKVPVKSIEKQMAQVPKNNGDKRKAANQGNKSPKKQKFEKTSSQNNLPKKRNNKNKRK